MYHGTEDGVHYDVNDYKDSLFMCRGASASDVSGSEVNNRDSTANRNITSSAQPISTQPQWGLSNFQISMQVCHHLEQSGRNMTLVTRFQLIPTSKMCGVLLPRLLYALMVWCLNPGTTSYFNCTAVIRVLMSAGTSILTGLNFHYLPPFPSCFVGHLLGYCHN